MHFPLIVHVHRLPGGSWRCVDGGTTKVGVYRDPFNTSANLYLIKTIVCITLCVCVFGGVRGDMAPKARTRISGL